MFNFLMEAIHCNFIINIADNNYRTKLVIRNFWGKPENDVSHSNNLVMWSFISKTLIMCPSEAQNMILYEY